MSPPSSGWKLTWTAFYSLHLTFDRLHGIVSRKIDSKQCFMDVHGCIRSGVVWVCVFTCWFSIARVNLHAKPKRDAEYFIGRWNRSLLPQDLGSGANVMENAVRPLVAQTSDSCEPCRLSNPRVSIIAIRVSAAKLFSTPFIYDRLDACVFFVSLSLFAYFHPSLFHLSPKFHLFYFISFLIPLCYITVARGSVVS
jgi:hypothetical protein